MDEELKARFIAQKIKDIINNNCQCLPTILCEMEHPHIIELVRRNCLLAPTMVPFSQKHFQPFICEGLEIYRGQIDFGNLYILVSVN
jgi:hypothetical protein